jgi:hypothetical protein
MRPFASEQLRVELNQADACEFGPMENFQARGLRMPYAGSGVLELTNISVLLGNVLTSFVREWNRFRQNNRDHGHYQSAMFI